jgi:uncharacterized protein (DUF433 family)
MRLLEPLLTRDPRDGTLVLTGTHVPVDALVRALKADRSIDDVAEANPGARRGHLVAIVEALRDAVPALAVPSDDAPGAVIVSWPERRGGTPTFVRSRVPVDILFDYLSGGDTVAMFLDQYPGITVEQVHAVIDATFAHAPTFAD